MISGLFCHYWAKSISVLRPARRRRPLGAEPSGAGSTRKLRNTPSGAVFRVSRNGAVRGVSELSLP